MYPIASISESGTTATVTLSAPGIPVSNIAVGDSIFIVGNIAGYNNTLSLAPTGWTVSDVVSTTQIQFVAASSGLNAGGHSRRFYQDERVLERLRAQPGHSFELYRRDVRRLPYEHHRGRRALGEPSL